VVGIILILLLIFGSIGVIVTSANDIGLETVSSAAGLTEEENAYYEYVAPRLDRLVVEVDDVVVMVENKSRDILALTISGNRIETLTSEITEFGDSNGVPERFQGIHERIVSATDTTTYTFDQAREALKSFDFSQMSGLVIGFQNAADELHDAQQEMNTVAGGTERA
jgi:phage replication-related protein YjqB (UPF0714/DUF867 family)